MKIWNEAGIHLSTWAVQTAFREVVVLIRERGVVTPYLCVRTGLAADLTWTRLSAALAS